MKKETKIVVELTPRELSLICSAAYVQKCNFDELVRIGEDGDFIRDLDREIAEEYNNLYKTILGKLENPV